jgi:cellulose synthase operon protein C
MATRTIKPLVLAMAMSSVVIAGCGDKKTYDEYIAQANLQIAENQNSAAILSLKNAIRIEPRSANARYQLGVAYAAIGNFYNAEKELERAVELGVAEPNLIPKLAQVKMQLGKSEAVYQLADESTDLSDENYVALLTYAGIAAISAGNIEQAQDYIAQASAISEDSLYSRVGGAWLDFYNDNFDSAYSSLQSILADSEFSEALLLAGHMSQAKGDFRLASERYLAYLEKHPQHVQIKLYLVNSLINQNEYIEAEKHLNTIGKLFEQHPVVNLYKAQVAYNKKDYAIAKLSSELAIEASDGLLMAKLVAGLSAYHLGEFQLSYRYLNSISQYLPVDHDVKKLLAMLQLELGFEDDASLTFEQMSAEDAKDINILNSASVAFSQRGRGDLAEKLLGKLQQAQPDNDQINLQYNAIKVASGDLSSLNILEELAKDSEVSNDAHMILATHYINQKEFDKALETARQWQEKEPESLKAVLLEGFIYDNQKERAKAIAIFESVINKDMGNIPANYYLGSYALEMKRLEHAKEHYVAILDKQPLHKASLAKLSLINAQLNKVPETLTILDELIKKYPSNQDLLVDWSINKGYAGEHISAIERLNSAVDAIERGERYNRTLARLYFKTKQYKQAEDIYKELTISNANNLNNWLELAATQEELDYLEVALSTINQAIGQFNKQPRLLLIKSNILMRLNRLSSASRIIDELDDKYPDNNDISYMKGVLAIQEERYSTAVANLNRVYQRTKSNHAALNLARALIKQGSKDKATSFLDKHIEKNIDDNKSIALLAEAYLSNDPKRSVKLYKLLLERFPRNLTALNNISWAYAYLDDVQLAEKYSEQAFSLSNSNPSIIDTYARMLIKSGKGQRAVDIIQQNNQVVNTTLKLTLAEAYINISDIERAREVLNELAPKAKKDSDRKLALLKQI